MDMEVMTRSKQTCWLWLLVVGSLLVWFWFCSVCIRGFRRYSCFGQMPYSIGVNTEQYTTAINSAVRNWFALHTRVWVVHCALISGCPVTIIVLFGSIYIDGSKQQIWVGIVDEVVLLTVGFGYCEIEFPVELSLGAEI
jgi:hypothetical protein